MSRTALQELQDTVTTERLHGVRIIVSIPGRYSLASRRDGSGERREFACRAVGMSPQELVLAAPVIGEIGERVIAHIEPFGRVEGKITRVMKGGFVVNIGASSEECTKLAAKIRWLEKNKNHDLPEGRKCRRIAPRNPLSQLVLGDGTRLTCLVIDMSAGGAAVSADVVPELGAPLAVGKAIGFVVRHLPEGFAVRFIDVLDPNRLEQMVIKS
jgi:PilZ domain-containing protein